MRLLGIALTALLLGGCAVAVEPYAYDPPPRAYAYRPYPYYYGHPYYGRSYGYWHRDGNWRRDDQQ